MAGFLVALAVSFWLDRYQMLYTDHGNLLVGHRLHPAEPGPALAIRSRPGPRCWPRCWCWRASVRWAVACAVVLVLDVAIPPLVSSLYVKPNELTLERPSCAATSKPRAPPTAWPPTTQSRASSAQEGPIDFARNQPCSTTSACGTGAPSMTRSARPSRRGRTLTPIRTSTATSSTASCARRCWPRASST